MSVMDCKKRAGNACIYASDHTVSAPVFLHPKGCLSARRDHMDVVLSRDPCGLKSLFSKGGHCIEGRRSGDYILIDLSSILGYPCLLEIPNPLSWTKVYLMLSRSGALYVSSC